MKISFLLLFCLVFGFSQYASAAPIKEWTVLLYLNGKNNLDEYGKLNLNQIEHVGSNDKMNIVVQWGSIAEKTTTRRLMIKDDNARDVTSPILENLGAADMGSKQTLEDFLNWGAENFPAQHYFVIVWNHGTGWHSYREGSKDHGISMTDISWDDTTGHSITTAELGTVITHFSHKIGKKVDIYGSDACLMGMVEVAGEMQDAVDYFVGSQDLEPGEGWPYDRWLTRANQMPTLKAADFAKTLVDEYGKYYQEVNTDITLSAVDMNEYKPFVDKVSALSKSLNSMPQADLKTLFTVVDKTQNFDTSDYIDFGDLAANISNNPGIQAQSKILATDALSSLQKFVLEYRGTGNFAKARGISIWFPTYRSDFKKYSPTYYDLAFNRATGWMNTIDSTISAK